MRKVIDKSNAYSIYSACLSWTFINLLCSSFPCCFEGGACDLIVLGPDKIASCILLYYQISIDKATIHIILLFGSLSI